MIRWKRVQGGLAFVLAALMVCQPLGVYAEDFTSEREVQADFEPDEAKEESGDAGLGINKTEEDINMLSESMGENTEDS